MSSYSSIKVIVIDSEFNLYDIEVFHSGGNWQTFSIIKKMKSGNETQRFYLDNTNKDLTKVMFSYDVLKNIKNPQIEFWGIKTVAAITEDIK